MRRKKTENLQKCDICGYIYTPYNETKSGDSINGIAFLSFGKTGVKYPKGYMRCCPDCLSSITNYIEHTQIIKNRHKKELFV